MGECLNTSLNTEQGRNYTAVGIFGTIGCGILITGCVLLGMNVALDSTDDGLTVPCTVNSNDPIECSDGYYHEYGIEIEATLICDPLENNVTTPYLFKVSDDDNCNYDDGYTPGTVITCYDVNKDCEDTTFKLESTTITNSEIQLVFLIILGAAMLIMVCALGAWKCYCTDD